MRISDQVMNETARRAGVPINASMLNHISDTESENTLLGALSKTDKAVSSAEKKAYEKVEKHADEYQKAAEAFLAEGKDSVFETARTSGDNQAVYDRTEELLKKYNQLVKSLKNSSSSLNDYYRQMLAEAAEENEEAFANLGISIFKDGTLNLDKSVLEKSSLGDMEKVFGSQGLFTSKTAYVASRAEDHARANVESYTSTYSSKGMKEASYDTASRYDVLR